MTAYLILIKLICQFFILSCFAFKSFLLSDNYIHTLKKLNHDIHKLPYLISLVKILTKMYLMKSGKFCTNLFTLSNMSSYPN